MTVHTGMPPVRLAAEYDTAMFPCPTVITVDILATPEEAAYLTRAAVDALAGAVVVAVSARDRIGATR